MNDQPRTASVLLADDDPFVISIYRDKLTRAGLRVDTVLDGEKAIERLQQTPPDLLVLDLNMPRLNGIKVLQYIREQFSVPNLPVIVLSNACAPDFIEQVNRLRPARFLIKSDNSPNNVVAEIQSVLAEIQSNGAVEPVPAPVAPAIGVPEEDLSGLIDGLEQADEAEARQQALLRLYRFHQDGLRALKGANPLSLPFLFGEALEQFFEEAYARPEAMSVSAAETLRDALPGMDACLGRIGEGPTPQDTILIHAANPELRQILRKYVDRPGFIPVQVAGEDTAVELIAENPFPLVVWAVRRVATVRKTLLRIKEAAHERKIHTVFLVSADEWPINARDIGDASCSMMALPLMAQELLMNLYVRILSRS